MDPVVSQTNQTSATNPLDITPKTAPNFGRVVPALFLALVILLFSGLGVFAFQIYVKQKPAADLKKVFENLKKVNSLEFSFVPASADTNNFNLAGVIHSKDGELSQASLNLENLDGISFHKLKVDLIASNEEVFAQANYSMLETVLAQLTKEMPFIGKLETVKMLVPAFSGVKWLHAAIPPNLLKQSVTGAVEGANQPKNADQKIMAEIAKKMQRAMILKNKGGVFGKVIAVGLNKTKLLEALEGLKQTRTELKLKDINNTIDLVKSSNDWDKELVEINLDDKNLPVRVVFRMPQIDNAALKKVVAEGAAEQGYLSFLKDLPLLNKLGASRNPGLETLFTLNLTNYNDAATVQRPGELIEFEDVLKVGQKELLPIIGQMMIGGSLPLAPTTGLPKQ